jgi:hypothetical protein
MRRFLFLMHWLHCWRRGDVAAQSEARGYPSLDFWPLSSETPHVPILNFL